MTDQPMPLVTVITPAYNRGETYLPAVLDSVLAQDYPNFEYIVLDDGSTDNTAEVLASYDDPRLRWETHANMGVIKTINKAFGMARGDYITVVNSDDPLLPGLLTESVKFLEAHPDVLASYPDWQMIDEHDKVIRHIESYPYSRVDMVRWSHCLPGPGTMLRRQAIDLTGGYDESYPHIFDHEFYLRLTTHGPIAHLPQTLANFRVHSGSISIGHRGAAMAAERMKMFEMVYGQPDLDPELLAVKREARAAYCYIAGQAVSSSDRTLAGRYFLRSIFAKPFGVQPNGPVINPGGRDWSMILLDYIPSALLPDAVRRPFGKLKTRLRGKSQRERTT